MRYLVLMVFASLLIACNTRYGVEKNFIRSNKKIEYGFEMSEISVDSINAEGLPIKFTKTRLMHVNPIDEQGLKRKKIYFNRKNKNYYWFDFQSNIKSDIMPSDVKTNQWYLINGLMGTWGNADVQIFFIIDHVASTSSVGWHTK